MSLERPPTNLARAVESRLPGAYNAFYARVTSANSGLPVQATSWWRSTAKNKSVGGARDSQHLLALGLDLVYPNAAVRALGKERMQKLGLVVIDEGDHVHTQLYNAGVLWAAGVFAQLGLA